MDINQRKFNSQIEITDLIAEAVQNASARRNQVLDAKEPLLKSCTYPYNPGFSQKQRNKATVFFLAFLGKIRVLGLVLCVKLTSFFLGARCESIGIF